jgi:glycosyltransferase involved in cell wall biosynthesis
MADVHFVIVGEGPFRGEYMRRAAAYGLGDRVTWTGLVEDPLAAGVYDTPYPIPLKQGAEPS